MRLRDRTLRSMMLSLPSREPRRYLYDVLPQYPLRQGKGLRPALCLSACAAFGGSYEQALPFAAALELLHNAFLVHDDIQDGSAVRRGRRALHEEQGVPLALNAGDALAAAANAAFLDAVRPLRPAIGDALIAGWERMTLETLEGQALDLGWQRDNVLDMSVEDYLEMCGKKTAWYTAVQPLAMGAILGSGDPQIDEDVFPFGWLLGLLFQLANDLDGLDASTGKSDVAEGKRTAQLIHLLGSLGDRDRGRVSRIMGKARSARSSADIAWVHGQMESKGSVSYVRSAVLDLADAADEEAEAAFGWLPDGDARELLLWAVSYVVEESSAIPPAKRRPAGSQRLPSPTR